MNKICLWAAPNGRDVDQYDQEAADGNRRFSRVFRLVQHQAAGGETRLPCGYISLSLLAAHQWTHPHRPFARRDQSLGSQSVRRCRRNWRSIHICQGPRRQRNAQRAVSGQGQLRVLRRQERALGGQYLPLSLSMGRLKPLADRKRRTDPYLYPLWEKVPLLKAARTPHRTPTATSQKTARPEWPAVRLPMPTKEFTDV